MTKEITPDDVMKVVYHGSAESLDWLARWFKMQIAAIPASVWESRAEKAVGTPGLTVLLGLVTLSGKDNHRFRVALGRLRKSGRVDGYWSPHPNRKHMGHPVILWHPQGVVPAVCAPADFPVLPEMF